MYSYANFQYGANTKKLKLMVTKNRIVGYQTWYWDVVEDDKWQ